MTHLERPFRCGILQHKKKIRTSVLQKTALGVTSKAGGAEQLWNVLESLQRISLGWLSWLFVVRVHGNQFIHAQPNNGKLLKKYTHIIMERGCKDSFSLTSREDKHCRGISFSLIRSWRILGLPSNPGKMAVSWAWIFQDPNCKIPSNIISYYNIFELKSCNHNA